MLEIVAKSRFSAIKFICSFTEDKRQMSICLTNKMLACLDKVLEQPRTTLRIDLNRKLITTAIAHNKVLSLFFCSWNFFLFSTADKLCYSQSLCSTWLLLALLLLLLLWTSRHVNSVPGYPDTKPERPLMDRLCLTTE